MYLSGASGKISRAASRLRDLVKQAVLELGVDLEGVAEADLPVLEARILREPLVDELRGQHGGRLLDGVGGRQVVVLAGVDHDPATAMMRREKF